MNINQPQTLEAIQAQLGTLPKADVPAALLPVRLETRFKQTTGKTYLCLRIFPDDLHLDTHEPLLTQDENRWGKHLWEQVWISGHNPSLEQALQDELAQRFGPGRAAWIAKALTPLNIGDRPPQPNSTIKPVFPDLQTRTESWTMPPQLKAMPDRWVLFGYRQDRRILTVLSNPVHPELTAGLDPQPPNPADPKGKLLMAQRDDNTVLPLDERMKWMVDFEEAVLKGMGFQIELASQQEAEIGFDRLVVLGIDTQSTAQTLEDLLASQRYTDSLDFVPQGTPSNNTAEAKAGYASTEPEQRTTFSSQQSTGSLPEGCNAQVAARALGLAPEILAKLPHTLDREQLDAQAMNTALWPATWGYFFRYILTPINGQLNDDALERLRHYFIQFVRARGPIPTLRIGRQPYGIIPVTSLDRFQFNPANPKEVFGVPGLEILKKIRDRWR